MGTRTSISLRMASSGATITTNDNSLHILNAPFVVTLVRGTAYGTIRRFLRFNRAAINAYVSISRSGTDKINRVMATFTGVATTRNEGVAFSICTRGRDNSIVNGNIVRHFIIGDRGFLDGICNSWPLAKSLVVGCGTIVFSFSNAIYRANRKVQGDTTCTLRSVNFPIPRSRGRLGFFVNPPLLIAFRRECNTSPRATRRLIGGCERHCAGVNICRDRPCSNVRRLLRTLGRSNLGVNVTSSGPGGCVRALLRESNLVGCFSDIYNMDFAISYRSGTGVVNHYVGRLGSPPRRAVVINSGECSVRNTGTGKVLSINIL